MNRGAAPEPIPADDRTRPDTSLVLRSNGSAIPFTDRYFARLGSVAADSAPRDMRRVYDRHGVLYVRNWLDPAAVSAVRDAYLSHFTGPPSGHDAEALPPHGHPGHPAYAFVRSETFLAFADQPRLKALAGILLGTPAKRLRRTPLRHFMRERPFASRAHTDHTYVDLGTSNVVTIWVPIGDCPLMTGGIVYLEDSAHLAPDGVRGAVPTDRSHDRRSITHDLRALSEATGRRWLHADYGCGDVVVHSPFIVHASLNTLTDAMRISTDVRFIPEGEDADPRWMDHWSATDGF